MSINRLNRFINNENITEYKNYTLSNIIALLKAIGNPHEKLKFFHIAGTNGKGSVSYMLNNILINSGYKTGLFISPHLVRINERIQINSVEISDNTLNQYIEEIIDVIDNSGNLFPTYFDILTVIGLKYFFENSVEICIMETGMGGRLDSTNVITPLCSIITDISMDHVNILGSDIREIAIEKSGIIKHNIPVVTSNSDNSAIEIIRKKCVESDSTLFQLNKDFIAEDVVNTDNGYIYNLKFFHPSEKIEILKITINLIVSAQIKNSSIVIASLLAVAEKLNKVNHESIRRGILNVNIPGRFEILSVTPLIIFDPAHNTGAIKVIMDTLNLRYRKIKLCLIISIMKDKEYDTIIKLLTDSGAFIIYYELDDNRVYRPSINRNLLIQTIASNTDSLVKILNNKLKDFDLFLFTGSFRLYETAIECKKRLKL